ncbi:MAG: thiamine diphosphokinase [Clostridia bacterium]|nr:thiamine diphosphokinase [Clostridia bacterium]
MDCYVFGAGERSLPPAPPPREAVLVIAADGGYTAAAEVFGAPDLAVGDFDSLGYVPKDVTVVCHPPEKDETDLFLAVREGLGRGATRFFLMGALGARLDHTVANLQLLAYLAEHGVEGYLIGADGVAVTALAGPASLALSAGTEGTVSVLAHGGSAEGVTLSGFRYPLKEGTLTADFPLGVSNEVAGAATVTVARGTLLVFFPIPEGKSDWCPAVSHC